MGLARTGVQTIAVVERIVWPKSCIFWVGNATTSLQDGVEGELIIGGAGVALGYWNRPELTSARFFESSGHRCFRSGDRVVRKGGELFCLGRLDEQVKLNGFRIELGEIEALLGSEGMQAAVQVRRNLKDLGLAR